MMNPEEDPSQNQNQGLHVCPDCKGVLVQPVDKEAAYVRFGQQIWLLYRRCAECDWGDSGLFETKDVKDFEERHEESLSGLRAELSEIEHTRLSEAATSLRIALDNDLIGPDDFGRPIQGA